MCLSEKKRFKPVKEGYQVKRKLGKGRYQSIYFSVRGGLEIGITYIAKRRTAGAYDRYLSGFHVFHNLKDAEAYRESSHCRRNGNYSFKSVIIKVKAGGRKITGLQKFWSGIQDGVFIRAKITVCSKMTVLEEISK